MSELIEQYVLPTYGRFPITPVKGSGCWLWDENGRRYLDFCMGIATCSLGHCHPVVTKAIQKQAETLVHCSNLYRIPGQGELAKIIVEECVKLPGKVFFSNSGAEANEGMIKVARRFGHQTPDKEGNARTEIIAFTKSFHGRTMGAMAATGQDKIKIGFTPQLLGFKYVDLNDLEAVKAAITSKSVAFILEPVQGEGGVNPVTREFLEGLQELAAQNNMLIMMDEVQAGFGRCGEMMGFRAVWKDFSPDVISWAKGLGGGVPIGAFWVSARQTENGTTLCDMMGPGSHGSTFGGNPLVCATATAVLKEILQNNLPDHVKKMGAFIRQEIESWNFPVVTTTRGLGLLIGVALDPEKIPCEPGQTPASVVVNKLMQSDMLAVPAGPETLRLLPPLNVEQKDVEEGLRILKGVLEQFN